ncbi:MAG: type I glyceraldehyde-3-phosphate dehydrogenase [Acidimicrobiia bacterium]|nr:MAG: type I glyceraldehyde-3-phosphate dehydrogenase [Acidimicrobiia bacterium]
MRVAINGFGRIGRNFLRAAKGGDLYADLKSAVADSNITDAAGIADVWTRLKQATVGIDVVAINDLSDPGTLAYLFKHDSVHGLYQGTVELAGNELVIDGDRLEVLSERDPSALPWGDLGVDVVIESTGLFRTHESASKHLAAGARWVIVSAPMRDPDYSIVFGVNDGGLDPEQHRVISNASCTTNCVAPMIKILHDAFGVRRGMFTTVHAYTNDQRMLDLVHKDLRRARAAAINVIPTSTGAATAVGKVMPEMEGKFEAKALRVPVADGSITDLVVSIDAAGVSTDAVNGAFRDAAQGPFKGIVKYSEEALVSSDIIGDPHSVIFDAGSTMVNDDLVKVFGWYDNEMGYASRLVDLVRKFA